MKRLLVLVLLLTAGAMASAQFKLRPDAFPPEPEPLAVKAVTMAADVSQMAQWDRYPTYGTYVAMMQQWAADFPALCRLDTIGTSIQGRLILSLEIAGDLADTTLPEFFYSSTIHGDEVTGYVMMLRLIDTLLHGYGSNPFYTRLVNTTRICINPLANPDGTYRSGDNTVQGAQRYNANYVDLNRNYPNPFGSSQANLQQENAAMISYVGSHQFRLSANLHGGSEVMNYPWDCFTSAQNPHPKSAWWQEVCKRLVDTIHTYTGGHFNDVTSEGYIAGGDWYVITGGRQDYMNYYHNCLELTMEVSTTKLLGSSQLPVYWNFLQHSLVNYIDMIHHLNNTGRIGLVLANGALSTQSSGEGEIRKKIIEDDLIEGIIAMPTQLFYSVTIPVTLWFITKNKKRKNKTLFIDARNMGHMIDRKHRDLSDENIKKLANTFEQFRNGTLKDVKGFCATADIQDIAKQDYILTPGRYVGIEEQEDDGEPFEEKMARLTSELSDMFAKSHELEDEIRRKLGAIGYEI